METVNISTFKATCLELLKRVKQTGQPLLMTRRGEPVAEIVPPRTERKERRWLGSARKSGKIHGDMVSPTEEVWEVLEMRK